MKQIFTSLMGFSLLAFAVSSCTKESHEQRSQQTTPPQLVSANVSAGQSYVLNLGASTVASIKAQAQHAQYSALSNTTDGTTVYKYTAAKGFTGADEVTLQQTVTYTTQSGGNCGFGNTVTTSTSYKTIVVRLNIAN